MSEVWVNSADQSTATVSGRIPVSIWKKLQPWWWFGNDNEPVPPAWYSPGWPTVARWIGWYLRNPLENFGNYVIGVVDRNYTVVGTPPVTLTMWADVNQFGWKWSVIKIGLGLPFASYSGKWVLFYAGWMPGGFFGFKFNIRNSPIQGV